MINKQLTYFWFVLAAKINSTCSTIDPYVQGVGNIQYNDQSNAFVVSGYTDFTVWKQENGEARVWSHSLVGSNSLENVNGFSFSAVFLNNNTVIAGSSTGFLDLYTQQF